MKKTFTLSVPKPCHEKWEEFNPTTLGGFCSSCQKEVIDFTSWDEDQIKSYFKNRSQTSCGRFYPTQLRSYTLQEPPKFNFMKWTLVPFISVVMLLFSRNAQAQKIDRAKIERVQTKGEVYSVNSDTVRTKMISGIVKSAEDQSLLPGVNVVLKGTHIYTTTDGDGRFSITVLDPRPDDTLVFSFIGLKAVEHSVYNVSDLPVSMTMEITVLGGYHDEGFGIRNIWWGIRNLFTKN
jgi:hypothetical protein